jgi:hypothetical protein
MDHAASLAWDSTLRVADCRYFENSMCSEVLQIQCATFLHQTHRALSMAFDESRDRHFSRKMQLSLNLIEVAHVCDPQFVPEIVIRHPAGTASIP